MKAKRKVWILSILLFTVGLSACALNNEIVIQSKESYQSNFTREGFEFRFPSQSDINLVPMHGATWLIGGDLSDIIRNAVAEIDAVDFENMSSDSGSFMEIKEITLRYQDEMPGGPDTYLSVALKMRFTGQYDGLYINNCQEVEAIPAYPPPVSHGVFDSRDKLRPMVQPVYEGLIKEALSQALITGLNCLSNKSESKLMD